MILPMKRSPLAPEKLVELGPVRGARFAAIAAGVKYEKRDDVLLFLFDPDTQVAGVFTKSKTASAPVEWCRTNLQHQTARALLVNAGNANAFTGAAGYKSVADISAELAKYVPCSNDDIYIASTGVIGEPLPDERITSVLEELVKTAGDADWQDAARAIMTTDTFPKLATRTADIDGEKITINAIAKGSGMIAPDMATMLSFLVTDALIPADILQTLLAIACDKSFNSITVDSDTSTSDTVLAFATGCAANTSGFKSADDPLLHDFRRALDEVLYDLAHQVVCDGEGASKFITVDVEGAENEIAARRIGLSIANSPLVKTAIAGEDANWGRIVMAVGKSGEHADRDKLAIWIGPHLVAENGERAPAYDEAVMAAYMKSTHIDIKVDVGVGKATWRVWTCDLTYEYIRINADYRS